MPAFSGTARTTTGGAYDLGEVSGFPVSGYITALFGAKDAIHVTPHSGLDIGAPQGTPVYAPAAGTVTYACQDGAAPFGPTFGNSVCIQHEDGMHSLYGHFVSTPAVHAGQAVQAGTLLGLVGATGKTDGGAHLHWGLAPASNPFLSTSPNAVLLDPLAYAGDPGVQLDTAKSEAQAAAGFSLNKIAEATVQTAGFVMDGLPAPVALSKIDWLIEDWSR